MRLAEFFNFFSISFFFINDHWNVIKFENYFQKNFNVLINTHIYSQHIILYIIYYSSILEFAFFTFDLENIYKPILLYIDNYFVSLLININIVSGLLISKKIYKNNRPFFIEQTIRQFYFIAFIYFLFDRTTQRWERVGLLRALLNLFTYKKFKDIQNLMKNKIY